MKIKLPNKKTSLKLAVLLSVFIFSVGIFQYCKSSPQGTNYASPIYKISENEISFLHDLTYQKENISTSEQEIFNNIFTAIDNASEYILIDMFLFNPHQGVSKVDYQKLSSELTNKLITKKIENPNIKIDFITDPINNIYGGDPSEQLLALKNNNINVIITDLTKMRDSNILYSPFWRIFFRILGNSANTGLLPNPFTENKKVTLRTYLSLLNFKANHRKIFLADDGANATIIISSANPHDASALHSNVAFKITNKSFAKEIYQSELAVAKFSNGLLQGDDFINNIQKQTDIAEENIAIQLLTEKEIKNSLIQNFNQTEPGDKILMAMFYLSDRQIIESLIKASKRGVEINIILDPNKDAFGREKNGIPNRQVAYELVAETEKPKLPHDKINIRWYNTNGEQFHSKISIIEKQNGITTVILGSANLTRRNINDYNLETDLLVKFDLESKIAEEIKNYFYTLWENKNGDYTSPPEKFIDSHNTILYRLQEFTGFCSF